MKAALWGEDPERGSRHRRNGAAATSVERGVVLADSAPTMGWPRPQAAAEVASERPAPTRVPLGIARGALRPRPPPPTTTAREFHPQTPIWPGPGRFADSTGQVV